eukprot:365075-Chlamydomonas_euryale.AAC.5
MSRGWQEATEAFSAVAAWHSVTYSLSVGSHAWRQHTDADRNQPHSPLRCAGLAQQTWIIASAGSHARCQQAAKYGARPRDPLCAQLRAARLKVSRNVPHRHAAAGAGQQPPAVGQEARHAHRAQVAAQLAVAPGERVDEED